MNFHHMNTPRKTEHLETEHYQYAEPPHAFFKSLSSQG